MPRFRHMHPKLIFVLTLILPLLVHAMFNGTTIPPKGILCSGHDNIMREALRKVQEGVLRAGIETTFFSWDGIDDSIKDGELTWQEFRLGLDELAMFDAYGDPIELTQREVETLLREFGDDDNETFVQRRWGSSFYATDGSNEEAIAEHNRLRPVHYIDGELGNAMCQTADGQDLEICNKITLEQFTKTVQQVADMKYSQSCNGHGTCDFSMGFCLCDDGWSGFNCSEPEKPCSGVRVLTDNYGSFSDGFGVGRRYGFDLNCTWLIRPDATDFSGLPLLLVFTYFDTEEAYDPVTVYRSPYVRLEETVINLDGYYPKELYSMPQLVVVDSDAGVVVTFVTDETNSEIGFRCTYGIIEHKFVDALKHPLLAQGCNRKFPTGSDEECQDSECTNCGVTTTEVLDEAVTRGRIDNMCYSSQRDSNTTHGTDGQFYEPCGTVIDHFLTFPAGSEVTFKVACPTGTLFTAVSDEFLSDAPEYILGQGPPQTIPRPEEGQAYQRGYIVDTEGWWDSCDSQCITARRNEQYNPVYQDESSWPGPIMGALLYARNTSRASTHLAPWVTFGVSRFSGIQWGYPEEDGDIRTAEEANSGQLRHDFGARFHRCSVAEDAANCPLRGETCTLTFTPTTPGYYQADFFKFEKTRYVDTLMRVVPFPEGQRSRTAVIVPAPTAPMRSHAHGPGLEYAFTTRAGSGTYFWIDSYDRFGNPRLAGGDQYNVVLVNEDRSSVVYGDVTNMGNGSYYVGYNITRSGRYSLSVTLEYQPDQTVCDRPVIVDTWDGQSLGTGKLWCHVGVGRQEQIAADEGVTWCPFTNQSCLSWTFDVQNGLSPIPPASPWSIWVDSGPTQPSGIQAYGTGLSLAQAGFASMFGLRISDVFGNWASQRENVTVAFELPNVAQSIRANSTSPTSAAVLFAGDENWQGDYLVEWYPYLAGWHSISVMLCRPACQHIAGSPFSVLVHTSPTYGPNSTVDGLGVKDGQAGAVRSFRIQDRDVALNDRTVGGTNFEVVLTGLSLADCPLVQADVLHDIVCKCEQFYTTNVSECFQRLLQDSPGPDISPNIRPELTCKYRRSLATCPEGCCPDGSEDGCSTFTLPPTAGKSAREKACEMRTCSSPEMCKAEVRAAQRSASVTGDVISMFLHTAMDRCPQIERIGLEAGYVFPPDPLGDKTYNLIFENLEPSRPIWRGPMSYEEVQEWINEPGRNLQMLYYTLAEDVFGPYFAEYGAATGPRSQIEGFVSEYHNTFGLKTSATSTGPVSDPLYPLYPQGVGNMSTRDNQDGTYDVWTTITRAGMYSLAVMHNGQLLRNAPFNFMIRPEPFDAGKSIVNGTGTSHNKNVYTGDADYKGAIVAGKFVHFDILLRDRFWNYLWESLPENMFRIAVDPMRISYFDTGTQSEQLVYWNANFAQYYFHDYGDANSKVDYILTTAGTFPLRVMLRGADGVFHHLDKSPYMMVVRPGKLHVPSSTAYGAGLTTCGAGLVCTFGIEPRDKWGNRRVTDGDEGPYCHTWNANINNGGSGGNDWRQIFPFGNGGCVAGDDCVTQWTRWANTLPASGSVVDGPEEPQAFPAYSNDVAYNARGGVLHDCVPKEPFSDPAQYLEEPSCISSRLGPCGIYDEWGRRDQAIWRGPDNNNYTWIDYRAVFPDLRPRFTAQIAGAEPVTYQNFDVFIDELNLYSASYNLTKAGVFTFAILYVADGTAQHISGSPFELHVSGGLTEPRNSLLRGQGFLSAMLGHPGTFSVFARDRFNNERTLGREKVEVFIQGNARMRPLPALVLDKLDGTYYVEYNATVCGSYQMTVSLLDKNVPGSPFLITVQKGFNFVHFNSSWGLNFAGDGQLLTVQGKPFCWAGEIGCVSLLQLNHRVASSTGAVWYNTMQRVSHGFETTFNFQITQPSRHCKSIVVLEDRCMYRGGDGLAFVIHENGFPFALGSTGGSMGYGGIDNSIAIEFDTWYNAEFGDVYQNHVAVHTGGREPNSATLRTRVATTSDVPNLDDGSIHTVRIRYEPKWDYKAVSDEGYTVTEYGLGWIQHGAGLLTVWVDDLDRPVLVTPLNIERTLALDNGAAWVGFTSSTGEALQLHTIHSWSFVDSACPNNCLLRGSCIDGECQCEENFYGEDCSLTVVEKDQQVHNVCPMLDPGVRRDAATNATCSCRAGFYGPIGGPCYACPENHWKAAPGESDCVACPPNSDTAKKSGVSDRTDCVCKAGYHGPNGGPCVGVPVDTYKVAQGEYEDAVVPCPDNSGTVFRHARSNVLECVCRPGYTGPAGGPCIVCPSGTWKSGWGDHSCESTCLPNSETFGCDGPDGNTACTSAYQCVCSDGFYGVQCPKGSPQDLAGKTCPPCVRSEFGPMSTDWELDKTRNPKYHPNRKQVYTIPQAEHRESVKPFIPPEKYWDGIP